ncbi:hypothetical protein ACX4ER_003902 [Cronobacter dublinensis]
MKLIDLLVQELPKRGGWPEGVYVIEQGSEGYLLEIESDYKSDFRLQMADDWLPECVTRDQYEAALAAAQKPVWDGEGLPPVGCRIEAFSGGEWVEAIVTYNEPPECHGDAAAWKEVLAFDCKTTRPFWTDEFRPIRPEADKRRDEVIESIFDILNDYDFEVVHIRGDQKRMATDIVERIASGMIPHIRIE